LSKPFDITIIEDVELNILYKSKANNIIEEKMIKLLTEIKIANKQSFMI